VKLAVAQMVFGMLILGDYVWIVAASGKWPLLVLIFPSLVYDRPWFTILFILGLLVLGCGIAQFLKAGVGRGQDE